MLNRLLENWLDNANERAYQPVLCQMLVNKGHTIVHNTRHHPLEFGKDIITIAEDGIPCAYQLKGNPGGRLNLSQFRADVEHQLLELAYAKLNNFFAKEYPPHRSYLVTNGEVDEDVQALIDKMNETIAERLGQESKIQLIKRGDLLKMVVGMEDNLWPATPKNLRLLLEIMSMDGKEIFPHEKLDILLRPLLQLEEESGKLKTKEFNRRVASASLLTATCLWQFSASNNHYATITAWVLYSVAVIGACARFDYTYSKAIKNTLEIARNAIWEALKNLTLEVANKTPELEEGSLFEEFLIYWHRYTLLVGVMSMVQLLKDNSDIEPFAKDVQNKVQALLSDAGSKLRLYGEGAIPAYLFHYWYLQKTDQIAATTLLQSITVEVIDRKTNGDPQGLISPTYSLADAVKHELSKTIDTIESPIQDYSFAGASNFSKALMELLAKEGKKLQCQSLWPKYTNIHFEQFFPDEKWSYCLTRVEKGNNISERPKYPHIWDELCKEARSYDLSEIPRKLAEDKLLISLYIFIFPQRARLEVIKYLDEFFK